jgi:acetyl esterase
MCRSPHRTTASSLPMLSSPPGTPPRWSSTCTAGVGWSRTSKGFDTLGRQLAQKSSAVVVLASYRKAPERPFPVPVEDAWTALRWTAERAAELAGGVVPLFVAGDSAGGNLAAVLARRSRDFGGPKLAGQILVYPVTDSDFSRPSYREEENQTLLTTRATEWFIAHYVPDAADRTNPDFARCGLSLLPASRRRS